MLESELSDVPRTVSRPAAGSPVAEASRWPRKGLAELPFDLQKAFYALTAAISLARARLEEQQNLLLSLEARIFDEKAVAPTAHHGRHESEKQRLAMNYASLRLILASRDTLPPPSEPRSSPLPVESVRKTVDWGSVIRWSVYIMLVVGEVAYIVILAVLTVSLNVVAALLGIGGVRIGVMGRRGLIADLFRPDTAQARSGFRRRSLW